MKYYKNPVNKSIYAYELDGSQDFIIPTNYIKITDKEADAILHPLPSVKIDQTAILFNSYATANSVPVTFTTEAKVTEIFQATQFSRDNLQAMIISLTATTIPSDFYWVALDNTHVPFTYNDLQGLGTVVGLQGFNNFGKLQGYKQQVNAATTTDDVKAIVWVN